MYHHQSGPGEVHLWLSEGAGAESYFKRWELSTQGWDLSIESESPYMLLPLSLLSSSLSVSLLFLFIGVL